MVHLNINGLVDGKIPAHAPCPFLNSCGLKADDCPANEKLHQKAYSCAAARAWSLLTIQDNVLLRKIHSK